MPSHQTNFYPKSPPEQILWAATWQNQPNECAPSEDSDEPRHPPSLIRVFAVRSMGSLGHQVSSCGQRRLWSDWADSQADQSLCWVYSHCVGFVMLWLILMFVSIAFVSEKAMVQARLHRCTCQAHLHCSHMQKCSYHIARSYIRFY